MEPSFYEPPNGHAWVGWIFGTGCVCLLIGWLVGQSGSWDRTTAMRPSMDHANSERALPSAHVVVTVASHEEHEDEHLGIAPTDPRVSPSAFLDVATEPPAVALNSIADSQLADGEPQIQVTAQVEDTIQRSALPSQRFANEIQSPETDQRTADAVVEQEVSSRVATNSVGGALPMVGEVLPMNAALPMVADDVFASMAPLDDQSLVCETGQCQPSGNRLGTEIHWAEQPADAYRQASEDGKLVFLIHVSGNFKIPGFT